MIATSFAESNAVLDPPENMAADCDALSVWRGTILSDIQVVISCWKLTAEELVEITKTGRVWLVIAGATMPPAALTGMKPQFNEGKP